MKRLDRFGYVMLGELATTRLFYAIHRGIYKLSGGRLFSCSLGCPVVLLTTTGRKSGESRTAPIFGFEEGKSVVVVPSDFKKFGFADSWHTRGFYERAGVLYHHARGTPLKELFWVPVAGGRWRIDWRRTNRGA